MSFKWDSPEMKRIIKGQIRRSFRRSPQFIECMKRVRVELPPLPKKDGSPSRKKNIKYRCEVCNGLFQQKYIQVDHIEPAIPLDIEETDLSYDEMVKGICCSIDNLQAICSTPLKENNNLPSCHRIKTNEENYIRRAIKQLKIDKKFKKLTQDLLDSLKAEYVKYLEDCKLSTTSMRKGKKKAT